MNAASGQAVSVTTRKTDVDPCAWDRSLAQLGGHPLQSALWGQSRFAVDKIRDLLLVGQDGAETAWLARIEERRVRGLGLVAWIPRGPTAAAGIDRSWVFKELKEQLLGHGFVLGLMSPWEEAAVGANGSASADRRTVHRTIWIDLGRGRERLWSDLDRQWRYNVGLAARSGVVVEQTNDPATVDAFFELCLGVSQAKGFPLPASGALMHCLLEQGGEGSVQARLFVARHDGCLGAGAFILRCGLSIHYLWGATDRALSKQKVGEAVQWGVIEWALEQGCTLYDLEGIDPAENPGTYQFKKRMGGREVELPGQMSMPLGMRGRVLSWMLTLKR